VRSLLALAALSGVAYAGPIASLAKDVDGDGAVDQIALDNKGELTIETKHGKSSVKLAAMKRASLAAGLVHGAPTVIVRADTQGIVIQGPSWKQVASVPIGGVGLDADYSVALEIVEGELYRFQARPGFQRCDDKPALLFAERFDAGKFVAAAKLPI